jgi:hypothetical protein
MGIQCRLKSPLVVAFKFGLLLSVSFLVFPSNSCAAADNLALGLFDYFLTSDDFNTLNVGTGYVDASQSRTNKFGERSSVAYQLKPHDSKLKVRIDHSCFSVKCLDGAITLLSKHNQLRQESFLDDCLFSSVSSLISSAQFTGRTSAFSSRRPSISDVRSGDILYGDLKCDANEASSVWRITSVHQLSPPDRDTFMLRISMRPATILDVASNGEYTFYTDNLLTVNDVIHNNVKPRFFDREWADTFSQDMVDMVRALCCRCGCSHSHN